MDDRLMTAQEVADFLQLAVDTVYGWARRGWIPAIKLHGKYRFRREEIRQWVRDKTWVDPSESQR